MRARIDACVIAVSTLAVYVWAVRLDLFESLVEYLAQRDEWELDEVLLAPIIVSVGLVVYALRWWREFALEVDRRRAAEDELRRLNATLEDRVRRRTDQLEKALAEIEAAKERYDLVALGAQDGLWDWDVRSDEVHYSSLWKQMLGLSSSIELAGIDAWLDLVHPSDRDELRGRLERQKKTGKVFSGEYRILHQDGAYRWMQTRAAAAADRRGTVTRIAGAQRDITEHKARDPLTGLPNRTSFADRLAQLFQHAASGGSPFAVFFLDLDRFKEVNDTFGHLSGDRLLVMIAERIRGSLRRTDMLAVAPCDSLVARFGGDEFAVLAPDVADAAAAQAISARILEAIGKPAMIGGRRVFPSASLGAALFDASYENQNDLLRDADIAMYASKENGPGRVMVFQPEMRASMVDAVEMEADLRDAVANGELFLEYQPKIRLADQELIGFEALLRWRRPGHGVAPPARFIPVAESSGLIVEVGLWVLREACRTVVEWERAGELPEDFHVSVNLSPKQLEDPEFVGRVEDCLAATGCRAARLHLEITESAILPQSAERSRSLQRLGELGVQLEIDDFGAGYSSLDHLRRFRFDVLKIDRRFVQDLDEPANLEIIVTLVQLARRLGMKVVAEGIESGDDLRPLVEAGCEIGQGFHFARPLPMEAARELLAGRAAPAPAARSV